MSCSPLAFTLRPAKLEDVPTILRCIEGLAEFERLSNKCVATEELLEESLFGAAPVAEVTLLERGRDPLLRIAGGGSDERLDNVSSGG